MQFYKKHIDDVLAYFDVSQDGLSVEQAQERLRINGPNAIKVAGEPWWRKIVEPFRSVFMAVLFVAAVISMVMDEVLDATIILAIIGVSATIFYVQRASSERVLRSLRSQDAQIAHALRDGQLVDVDAENLVVGDIVHIFEGERIPADVRVIQADNVRVDEALLTGESLPVSKDNRPLTNDKEVYERSNMLFQGSFLVSGQAVGIVVATANDTEFGQIAALARRIDTESPVQQKIDALLQKIIVVIGAITVVVFGLSLWRGIELLEALRFMIGMAVSAIPEGLPIAISVVLVLGMRRIAKFHALVRNMRAIENIGVVTTIATDKTGTLTKNQLSVQDVWQPGPETDLRLLARAIRLSLNGTMEHAKDPLDLALHRFVVQYDVALSSSLQEVVNLPFEQAHAMSGVLWRDKGQTYGYLKGAPEKVLAQCRLNAHDHEAVMKELHSLTGQGLRVIALAKTTVTKPASEIGDLLDGTFTFLGLIAVADQLREEVPAAIAETQRAGVVVRMITGDHFETAYAIGKQLGLVTRRDQVFDARQIAEQNLSDAALAEIVETARVFARVTPEYKHRILTILKRKDITAMTGDGVNDVPALTNAHVGLAMGSGSQIAKDAGDIVLLNDSFASIVEALREGRVVFDNIRRILYYLFATSVGEVLIIVTSLLIGLPLPVLAVQILWVNLVTDTIMVIPLGLEPAERDVMRRRPRNPRRPIIGKTIITRMVTVALTMVVVGIGLFSYFLQDYSEAYARTVLFSALVAMQWANAFNARSERQSLFSRLKVVNTKLYLGFAIAVTLQMMALFGPFQAALHIDTGVAWEHYAVAMGAGIVAVIMAAEIHKFISRPIYARAYVAPEATVMKQ